MKSLRDLRVASSLVTGDDFPDYAVSCQSNQ